MTNMRRLFPWYYSLQFCCLQIGAREIAISVATEK
jgi:hypothetical protein